MRAWHLAAVHPAAAFAGSFAKRQMRNSNPKSDRTDLSLYAAWGPFERKEDRMSDERALPAQARQAMATGGLPEQGRARIWGGLGSGASCALCGMGIEAEEMEFELQFPPSEHPGQGNYHVHAKCFAAWELERKHGRPNGKLLPRTGDSGIMDCERNATSQGEGG
jgi:hypothetical protein